MLLVAGSTVSAAQRSSGWFAGAEAGVAQYGTPKLNVLSGAVRVGHTLDRREMLRAAVIVSGAGIDVALLGVGAGIELRPLSPRRITPLLGAGGGVLHEFDYPSHDHGFVFLNAGVPVRVVSLLGVTLRAQYADSWKSVGFYTVHLGLEVGP